MKIIVGKGGKVRLIHDDAGVALLRDLGAVSIRRASHVEPIPGTSSWEAHLYPVGGPILGPFASRAEALAAELSWLKDHGIPEPEAV